MRSRSRLTKACTAILALLAAMMCAPASAASAAAPAEVGLRIYASHSEKCMSIPGGSKTPGIQATQFDCNPNSWAKRFYVETQNLDGWDNPVVWLRSESSGLCLAVAGIPEAGKPVVQAPCSQTHQWSWDKAGRLVYDTLTNTCLAVPHGWKANGVKLILWTCNFSREQSWGEY